MFKVSRSSNLAFLPFVFFLPEDLIVKCPTLYSLPRCMSMIACSEEHIGTTRLCHLKKENEAHIGFIGIACFC